MRRDFGCAALFAVTLCCFTPRLVFAQNSPTAGSAAASGTTAAQPQQDQETASERATALNLLKSRDDLKALPLLEDLHSKNANDIAVMSGLAQALLAKAAAEPDQDLAGKDRLRAKELVDKARQMGDHSQITENLYDTLQSLSQTGKVEFSSNADVDAAMRAGEAAFAKQDYDEAIKNYKHAFELDPHSYHAVLFVGDSYFAAKQLPLAGEWYTRAQKLDPNIETAFRYHSDMLTKQQDLDGARTLAIESIVAEPYNNIVWRGLIAWANAAKVKLQRVHIETGTSLTAGADGSTSITLGSNQSSSVMAVWIAYNGERILWRKEKFAKEYPHEAQYRHSLAEEVAALKMAAAVADEQTGEDKTALANDPNVQLLLRLKRANMLEPYVLINGADQGIAQDYVTYRANNREKLAEYLGEFVVPIVATKP